MKVVEERRREGYVVKIYEMTKEEWLELKKKFEGGKK